MTFLKEREEKERLIDAWRLCSEIKKKRIYTPMPVSDKDFIYFGAQRAAIHSSCTDMRRICIKFFSNSEASVALDCVLE